MLININQDLQVQIDHFPKSLYDLRKICVKNQFDNLSDFEYRKYNEMICHNLKLPEAERTLAFFVVNGLLIAKLAPMAKIYYQLGDDFLPLLYFCGTENIHRIANRDIAASTIISNWIGWLKGYYNKQHTHLIYGRWYKNIIKDKTLSDYQKLQNKYVKQYQALALPNKKLLPHYASEYQIGEVLMNNKRNTNSRELEKLAKAKHELELSAKKRITASHIELKDDANLNKIIDKRYKADNTRDSIKNTELIQAVYRIALKDLTLREIQIIKAYYFDNKTLREIGQEYKISRERVRQILEQTLYKLRCRLEPFRLEN